MENNPQKPITAEAVIEELGMNWNEAQRQEYLGSIEVLYFQKLAVPYPTSNYYVAATAAGEDQWNRFWHKRALKDGRKNGGNRRGVLLLDKNRLQHTIPQNKSVILCDAVTKEVFMIVLRNFIPDEELRKDMVNTCRRIISYRRDDRRDDPGELVHFGYTCGAMSNALMGLAKNERYITDDDHRQLNNASQGMAGIGWNMLRSRLPQFIIEDYEKAINSVPGHPRMDMAATKGTDLDSFTYKVKSHDVRFDTTGDLQLPPPSGLSAKNYARFTHNERNGNEWFVAVTCLAADDPSIGGNFYNASYGIMMEAASNTVSCFRTRDYHGTTLYEIDIPAGNYVKGDSRWKQHGQEERPDGGENIGFSFEISLRLRQAKAKLDAKLAREHDEALNNLNHGGGVAQATQPSFTAGPPADLDSDPDYEPSSYGGSGSD